MKAGTLKILLLGGLVAVGTVVILLRHWAGQELETERAALILQNERLIRTRLEQKKEAIATVEAVKQEQEAEAAQMHRQVTELEKQTAAVMVQATAGENRDPEKGLVKVEYFRNAGRSTPSAAFQTAIWASLESDEELAATMLLSAESRRKAEILLASLPDEARIKTPTPERLVASFFALEVLRKGVSAQFVEAKPQDDQHVVVISRLLMFNERISDGKIPMELGANGWQIMVPADMVDGIRQSLSRGTP